MKQFKCEICGGTSIIQIDERTYECQDCGLQYDIAEVEKLIVLPQENQVKELSQGELPTDFDSVGDNQSPVEIIEQSEQEEQFEVVSDDETEEITILKPSPKIVFDDLYAKLDKKVEESDEEDITDENPGESEIDDNISNLDEVPKPQISANAMAAMNAFLEETAENSNENIVEKTELTEIKSTGVEKIDDDLETDGIVDSTTEESLSVEDNDNNELQNNAVVAIPWFKNLKVIIPTIIGVSLIGVLILLFIFLPDNNRNSLPNDGISSENNGTILNQSDSTLNSTNNSIEEDTSNNKTEKSEDPSSVNLDATTDNQSSSSNTSTPKNANGITYEKEYYDNGQVANETVYKNGERIKETSYYENGNAMHIWEYKNGEQVKYTGYYENGNLECVCDDFKNIEYYENGKISLESEWKNGKIVNAKTYFENGKICSSEEYDENGVSAHCIDYIYNDDETINQTQEFLKDVLFKITWYENNRKYCVGEYSNDKMVKATWYDENGNVTATENY